MSPDYPHIALSAALAVLEDMRARPDGQVEHAVHTVKEVLNNLRTSRGARFNSFHPLWQRLFAVDRCDRPLADWDFFLDTARRFLQRPRTAARPQARAFSGVPRKNRQRSPGSGS